MTKLISRQILDDTIAETISYLFSRDDIEQPVQKYIDPTELYKCLSFDQSSSDHDHSVLKKLRTIVLEQSTRTGHPHFATQMYGRSDLVGMAAEYLLSVLNTNVHTYDVSPVLSTIERICVHDLAAKFGFTDNYTNADGVFVPGGTTGTLYALHLARHKIDSNIRKFGMNSAKKLVAFCSQGSHYSFKNSAILMGIGTDNVREILCDNQGRMLPDALEAAIKSSLDVDEVPFFIGATAGTTIMGAFDPISTLVDLAKKYGAWLHVDAAWGGAAQFAEQHKHLIDGINKADSLIFNIHKMLGAPLQCSLLLTHQRHGSILSDANSVRVPYLFQDDRAEHSEDLDIGKKTFQCGRKGDAIKYWLMKHAIGDNGFSDKVNACVDWSIKLADAVERRHRLDGSFVLHNQVFSTTCFWYIPKSLRPIGSVDRLSSNDKFRQLHSVAPKLKKEMLKSDHSLLISYASFNDMPNFFRWAFTNSPTPDELATIDIEGVLDQIDEMGRRIFAT